MSKLMHRRDLLRRLCYGIAAVPLIQACGSGEDELSVDSPGADAPDISGSDWATGGTAAMTDKASYPDPFTAAAASCLLVGSTTEGPCTTATDLAREDLSEGWAGLPVRLALRVVDSSCAPLVGATVKIWHTNLEGSYSGVTPNPSMCLMQQAYAADDFMRGTQVTDGRGVVFFDTCFPGWYRGRAIHVHFQIKVGNASTKVSQLFFPETITAGIFESHPEYSSFGQPDTSLASDNIIGGLSAAEQARAIFDVAQMTDGAMLASKTVTVTA